MNVWAEKQLDELGYVSRGRSRHRPRDEQSLYGGTFPFIQTADVKHAEFYISSHTQTYNEKGLAQSRLWQAGTLCITIAANIADTAILAYDACFPDSVIGFVADPTVCDVRFIKYFFSTVQSRYKQIAQGAAQDNLGQQKLLTLKIPTPSLPTQQRIADILSNYDRLIDNNTRRIALLEKSIHQLYKEWFIYLRFPGWEKVAIVDGVPEGWRRVSLKTLATLSYGKALKKDDRKLGLVPVYGSSGIVGYHNQSLVDGPGIILGRKGNVGSVFWSSISFYPI
ncbi:restriction endonuclease subunit S, partial [Leptolyngbyaceae cyanobacterium UHCC 1019]